MTVTVLDEAVGLGSQGYTLVRLLKIGEFKVRLRLERDSHMRQSYAVAEVFNTQLTWTAVLDNPPSNWYENLPYLPKGPHAIDEVRGALGSIADDLTNRMKTFLEA